MIRRPPRSTLFPSRRSSDLWTPEGAGREFRLSPALEPLADLKDDLLVLTNLWNQGSQASEGHYVKISGWLTCTTVTKDRKSTRLNSSHANISYAVFCLKKKK